MPKKKRKGLHPGGLLPRGLVPKIQPAVMPRGGPGGPMGPSASVAQPPAKNRNTRSVSPIMDRLNKKSLDEFNKNIRTRKTKVRPGSVGDQATLTNYKPPQRTAPSPSVSRPRGTDDAFMKKQENILAEFFRKNRQPKGVGRSARASGPGRRNRRAMSPRQPTFQPFRNYSYSNGGLTKSTTELSTGLKKAKDSK